MRKKMMNVCIIMICLLLVNGCGNKESVEMPELEQIKSICELSTLECVYNNVAKGTKTAGEGLEHLLEKDRKYWIEYEGYVKIGIDISQLEMNVDGENIKISMPEAEIQEIGIVDDTFTDESVISNSDSFWNKNKITAEDQKKVVADAQKEMEKEVKENKSIMNKATQRAKTLIENYIMQLGETVGLTYEIEWV